MIGTLATQNHKCMLNFPLEALYMRKVNPGGVSPRIEFCYVLRIWLAFTRDFPRAEFPLSSLLLLLYCLASLFWTPLDKMAPNQHMASSCNRQVWVTKVSLAPKHAKPWFSIPEFSSNSSTRPRLRTICVYMQFSPQGEISTRVEKPSWTHPGLKFSHVNDFTNIKRFYQRPSWNSTRGETPPGLSFLM